MALTENLLDDVRDVAELSEFEKQRNRMLGQDVILLMQTGDNIQCRLLAFHPDINNRSVIVKMNHPTTITLILADYIRICLQETIQEPLLTI